MEAIRPATTEDAQRFLELSFEFLNSLVSRRGGALLLAQSDRPLAGIFDFDRYYELLDDTHRRIMVGTIDETVMGMTLGHVEVLPEGTLLGHFDGCFVDPGVREVGLGRLLIEGISKWLQEQGCTGVDGVALPGDREAKNFFESAGFKARLLIMHRPFE